MFARFSNSQQSVVSILGAFVFAALMVSAAVPVVPIA